MRKGLRRAIGVLGLAAVLLAGFPATASADLSVEELTELERLLAELNFYPGTIDGVVDQRTRGAIRLYQDFAALPADGTPSKALLAELRQVVQVFLDLKSAQAAQQAAALAAEESMPEASPTPDRGDPAAEAAASEAPDWEDAASGEGASADLLRETEAEVAPERTAWQDASAEAGTPEPPTSPVVSQALEPSPAVPAEAPAEEETIAALPAPKSVPQSEVLVDRERAAEPKRAFVVPPPPKPAPSVKEPVGAEALTEPKPPAVSEAVQAATAPKAKGPAPRAGRAFDLERVIARLVERRDRSKEAGASSDPNLVLSIQRKLQQLGLDPGLVDGRMSARTISAIEAYQHQAGLPVDGRATRDLLTLLDGAAAGPAPRSNERVRAPMPPLGRPDGYRDFKLGFAAAGRGDFVAAIELYTWAIESGDLSLEHLADALFNRANAYHVKELYDYAIADYDAAILNKLDFPEAYHNRGFAFDAKGERERAVEDFKQARDLGLQRLGDRSPDILPPLP